MPVRELNEWYTLVRFNETPANLTGVAQTRSAAEALRLLIEWDESYPDDTTCIFDPHNAPVSRMELARAIERQGVLSEIAAAEPRLLRQA